MLHLPQRGGVEGGVDRRGDDFLMDRRGGVAEGAERTRVAESSRGGMAESICKRCPRRPVGDFFDGSWGGWASGRAVRGDGDRERREETLRWKGEGRISGILHWGGD